MNPPRQIYTLAPIELKEGGPIDLMCVRANARLKAFIESEVAKAYYEIALRRSRYMYNLHYRNLNVILGA